MCRQENDEAARIPMKVCARPAAFYEGRVTQSRRVCVNPPDVQVRLPCLTLRRGALLAQANREEDRLPVARDEKEHGARAGVGERRAQVLARADGLAVDFL